MRCNCRTILILISFLLLSCTKHPSNKPSLTKIQQDSLAFELCAIYGSDQGIRDMKLITRKETGAIGLTPYLDSINFFKLLTMVKQYGYPNERILGKENYSHECVSHAAAAVLLHTPHLLINNKNHLDSFLKEVEKGNMEIETLITVLDKYYVIRRDEQGHRMLRYGSQFGKPCKKYRKASDLARKEIGLAPLADSEFVDCNDE